MSAEQPKPQEGTFEGTQDYEALVADSARRGEPETREHNPVRAEHMGHAMKPHMEDATMLDTMSDKALAESQEARSAGSGARKLALWSKTDKLEEAASASRFAADEAANEARATYDDHKESK